MLAQKFYQRPTEAVARDLLGKLLVRRHHDGDAVIRINEVEAYLGVEDPACHTFGGRRTRRTETMWGQAGRAYVYLVYGLHNCLNVVTVGPGHPQAVLIRGAVVESGHDIVRSRRGPRVGEGSLTDGPGKLCQALGVTGEQDGSSLLDGPVRLLPGKLPDGYRITATPRIGIAKAADRPWRFVAKPQS